MTVPFTNADWHAVYPVGTVAIAALLVLIADLFSVRQEQRYVSIGIALAGTFVAAMFAARQYGHNYDAFFGGFMVGGFATVFQEVILMATAGSLILYGAIGLVVPGRAERVRRLPTIGRRLRHAEVNRHDRGGRLAVAQDQNALAVMLRVVHQL